MIPSISEAEALLEEGGRLNPGKWTAHCRYVAYAARSIAERCDDLSPDKSYVCGLLHDIGRRFGVAQLAHVYRGWRYLSELGYTEAARVALTHSFNMHKIADYVGKCDITPDELSTLEDALSSIVYDEYDYLIQLCDSIAMPTGIVPIEQRMTDVKTRYGFYPADKWNRNLELKELFENKMGISLKDLFSALQDDNIPIY